MRVGRQAHELAAPSDAFHDCVSKMSRTIEQRRKHNCIYFNCFLPRVRIGIPRLDLIKILPSGINIASEPTGYGSIEARPCGAPIVGFNMDRNVGKRFELFSDFLNLHRGNGRQFDHWRRKLLDSFKGNEKSQPDMKNRNRESHSKARRQKY